MIKYKAVCTTPVQSSKTLLFGSPAHERCWPTTCAHLIGHEIRSTIIQLCRKEPALWQVMSGTIIQLCPKKSLPLGRSPIIPILFCIYLFIDVDLISTIGTFADDTKLCKSVSSSDGVQKLREDLMKLGKWANDWQMSFNTDKCSVIHLGNDNLKHKYSLCGSDLRDSIKERDLGIIVDSSMKFTEQCNTAIKNANSTLGLIRRTIKCKSKNIITKLYKTLVRPKLEYCVQAWRPYLKTNIEI